jgi:signal transduction histidine kinase
MKLQVKTINMKVLIVVCAVFVIPYILSSFYVTSFIREKIEDDYIKLSDEQMERVNHALYYNVIEQASQAVDVFSKRKETVNLIKNLGSKKWKANELNPDLYDYLQIYKEANKNLAAVAVGSEEGGYFEYPSDGEADTYDPRVRPWYIPAIENPNEVIITDPYVRTNGVLGIAVSKAVFDDNGKIVGVIGFGWNIINFQKEIESIKLGLNGYIVILDRNNNMIVNQKSEIRKDDVEKLNFESNSIQKMQMDDKIRYAKVKVTDNGWKIISIMDINELDNQTFNIINSIKITYVSTLLAITSIFILIYLRFTIYTRKLLDSACAIMNGDKNIPIDTDRDDELGLIAKAFDKMICELEKRNKEITRLNGLNIVGQMASGLAHEIRNPMTTVRGYLQMMQRKPDCEKYRDRFTLMIQELDRANIIIKEFLSLAKNKLVNLQLISLNDIITNMHPLIYSDAVMQNKIVRTDLAPIPDLLLDENEIRQLILNLVRNSLEAMEEKKTLTLQTFFDGEDEVIFTVRDQGKGIDPTILENIGIPFNTTKDNGTGLGLPICYSIAERHGAKIKVKTGDNGTTVFIKFKVPDTTN